MQHPIPNLLRPSLVPELSADVAAGASGHVHLGLVSVSALGALPDEFTAFLDDFNLTIPAAALAVVALGVELGVDDVLVDELDEGQNSRDVVLHIGNLNIADGTTRRQGLELGLELQLCEGVNFLCHMDVIAVGDVVLVGDAGDHPKAALKSLSELIGSGFQGRAVQREVDVALFFPLGTGVVHVLHDLECERFSLFIRMAFASHVLDALVEAGVAKRDSGISIEEQLVDDLTLLQSSQGTILPKDRCDV